MAENTYIPRHELVELHKQFDKVSALASEQLMAIAGVVSVGFGLKYTNGEYQRKLCFKVTVLKKIEKQNIHPSQLIPHTLFGFETDVDELAPPGSFVLNADTRKYRPLVAGCQIEGSFCRTNNTPTGEYKISTVSGGTLGCIARVNSGTHNGKVVALTNWHVAVKGTSAIDGERVGQPTHNHCCTCCACNEIGTVIDGQLNTTLDAAIVLLAGQGSDTTPDVRFVNEILDIGIIAGSAAPLSGEFVFLRSRILGRVVKGQIANISFPTPAITFNSGLSDQRDISFTGQLLITPVGGDTQFGGQGESGAVVVNAFNQIVGLHFANNPTTGAGVSNKFSDIATALHIDAINSAFHSGQVNSHGVQLDGVPLSSAAFTTDNSTFEMPFEAMDSELRRYKAGVRFLNLFQSHQKEILHLVNNNREVMSAWNRYQGPAFLAQIIRSFHRNKPIDEEIKGIRLQNLLLKMTAVIQRNGSPELVQTVNENYMDVMQVFGTARTPDAWKTQLAEMENNIPG